MKGSKYPPESIIIVVVLCAVALYFWRSILGFILNIINLIIEIFVDLVEFAIGIGIFLVIIKIVKVIREKNSTKNE